MELSDRGGLSGFREWISRRVRSLSRDPSQKFGKACGAALWRQRNRLASGTFFVAAIILGLWANELAEADALARWERMHLPSERIIQFALGSRNFHSVRDENQMQKILRSIPSRLDESGAFWLSENANWVVFYAAPDQAVQAQLYCFRCETLPKQWKPVGLGWRGLEETMQEIDKNLDFLKPVLLKKVKAGWRDSREIVY
jgi:hypothetical protein